MNKLLLNIIMFIHLLVEIFFSFYLIIFYNTKKYDITYSILLFIIFLHWKLFKGECLLSYFEKKLLNNNYKMGDDIYDHPFKKMQNIYISILFNVLKFITLLIVFFRNLKNIYIFVMLLIIILNQFYHFYLKLVKLFIKK